MNQDRRLNVWIMLGSTIQIIASLILVLAGGTLGVMGFAYPEKLLKIDDLIFFETQDGIIKAYEAVFSGKMLKFEYLNLTIGIIVGVVGLIALAIATANLNNAKKRRIVRKRLGVFMSMIITLAIVACATTYLVLELKGLTDNIKYVLYGIIGVFGFVSLCSLFGLVFGRGEKFMSIDNNKYGFDKASMKEARADNNARNLQLQNSANRGQFQQNNNAVQPVPQGRVVVQQSRVKQGQRPTATPQQQLANMPARSGVVQRHQTTSRPVNSMQSNNIQQRTMQAGRPMVRPTQAKQPALNNQRPQAMVRPANSMQRPSVQQPVQASKTITRPAQTQQQLDTNSQRPLNAKSISCKRCGKVLTAGDKVCSLCGYKVIY